jgi:c-di-GMP-binding flagellar brake protein YcgR
VVLDISAGGCSFSFNVEEDEDIPELTVEDEMTVIMQPVGFAGDQDFAGILRSIRRSETRMTVGIQFQNLEPSIAEKLGSYVQGIVKLKD